MLPVNTCSVELLLYVSNIIVELKAEKKYEK